MRPPRLIVSDESSCSDGVISRLTTPGSHPSVGFGQRRRLPRGPRDRLYLLGDPNCGGRLPGCRSAVRAVARGIPPNLSTLWPVYVVAAARQNGRATRPERERKRALALTHPHRAAVRDPPPRVRPLPPATYPTPGQRPTRTRPSRDAPTASPSLRGWIGPGTHGRSGVHMH